MTEEEQRETTPSTLDVQQIIFERRKKEIQRKKGFTKSEIIEEVNDPATYKKVARTKKRKQ